MASKNTSSNSRQAVQRSNSDSARWIAGLLLLFIGLFAAAAVFFSFFSWAADQSGLQKSVEERVTLGIEPENLCGWAGARLGMLLVDHSFGLFGILIPAMIVLVGVRIVRQRPLLFNHSILSLFLILILGSLTLGFAFSDKWSLCSSTGWGGAFGIETAALLRTHIGVLGTLILLLGCWILTGVFINRNFINKVNRAGNVMVDKSGKIVEIVKHKVVHAHGQPSDAAGDAAAVSAESAGNPGERPARRSADTPAVESAVKAEPEVVVRRPELELAVQRPVPEMPRAVRTPGPAAAGTPAAEAEGLIAEVGAADSTATAETAVQEGNFDHSQNPLFAVLNPRFAGGASIGAAYKADMAAVNEYLAQPAVRELFPADIMFKWGVKGDDKIDGRFYLYAIKVSTPDGKAPLDGSVVTEATEQYAQRGATAEVSMTMNAEGTQEWSRMTGENIGKCIAIVLDGYVYSAPRVNSKIDKGQSQITGDFTIQEAKDLANVLNSGKVPAPAKIIQDTVVGPSLGQESINAGMISFVIAFILVLLYMGLFYKTAGWMSDVALLTNVFLLMGVLVSFGAVLTLPGIAGIVLTMGMAVDANVIIYERIKEELRGGKGLSLAIKDGFSKAYSAIIDGNLTTIITGIVLFIFGNGPVQGFATTLIIGIITSFFCAIFITRLLIEWIVGKWGHITFSRRWSENFLNNTRVDFIAKRKLAYGIAVALMVLSCVSFFARGLNLGAEFTGGRAYVIRFDKPVSAEEVRQNVEKAFSQFADADASSISSEVKQYGKENQMRIVTQYRYDDTSDEATSEVEQIIYDALKPLYSYDITFEQFRNTQTDANGILTADKIGPSIAKDMTWNAIYSVLFSLIAIGLYITFRFKRWQWASGATAALAFNALLIIGIFSMFYGLLPFNLEVNQAFIAAILTIIGYAINDTVVVFDRIREYLGLYPKRNLKETVNNAINSTLSRTINTSGTTLVTLLAIFFFGGETIRGFIFALIIGVVVGTAATIFLATPIAYDLMTKRAKTDVEK